MNKTIKVTVRETEREHIIHKLKYKDKKNEEKRELGKDSESRQIVKHKLLKG